MKKLTRKYLIIFNVDLINCGYKVKSEVCLFLVTQEFKGGRTLYKDLFNPKLDSGLFSCQ